MTRCPLLAQSGHSTTEFQCPLLGVKRTLIERAPMSAFDPKRTSAAQDCLLCKLTRNPISSIANPCCNRVLVSDSRRTPEPLGEAMRRRDFITAIAPSVIALSVDATLRPGHVFAETSFKRPLIACVVGGSKAATERFFGGFVQGMRELGYVEGRDYGLEVGYAEGDLSRIPLLAEELIRLKPDVFVSGTMAGVIAAKKLTDTIPIVSEALTDPVGFGLAASHARPGGNVTGVLLTVEDLPTKLLTLARELLPKARKIGLLVNSTNPTQPLFRGTLETAAAALGDELIVIEVSSRDDLHPAFQRFARDGAKVLVLPQDPMFLNERKRIALFAIAERLPTIFGFRENVEDGGLMSYGTDLNETWRRIATFVDKILKGTKPGDLPMEFPTKLQLVINLATAEALGLVIPPTVLARADEVIE